MRTSRTTMITGITISTRTLSRLFVSALLLAHLTSPYPTGTGQLPPPRPDLLQLQDLLDALESVSEQRLVSQVEAEDRLVPVSSRGQEEVPEGDAAMDLPLDEALIRELLSAKNLKQVRNNPNRGSSGCFGRRMDRIGSMSSLGCNTVPRPLSDAKVLRPAPEPHP